MRLLQAEPCPGLSTRTCTVVGGASAMPLAFVKLPPRTTALRGLVAPVSRPSVPGAKRSPEARPCRAGQAPKRTATSNPGKAWTRSGRTEVPALQSLWRSKVNIICIMRQGGNQRTQGARPRPDRQSSFPNETPSSKQHLKRCSPRPWLPPPAVAAT